LVLCRADQQPHPLSVATAPVIIAGDQIKTLVDDWSEMSAAQKRRVLDAIFSAVELDRGSLVSATQKPGWLEYLETALGGLIRNGLVGRGPARGKRHIALVKGQLVPAA
jgi:hypothetical protein